MGQATDAELWWRAVDGEPDAFGVLFERHSRAVYNYLFRRTADWSLAEDLTSIVFLEAWRRRRDVRLHGDVALPWLLGVATNVLRNRRRSQWRYGAVLQRLPNERGVDFSDDADARVDDGRRMRGVLRSLAGLPKREQEVLALCAWADLSYEEAALALDLPVGTVRSGCYERASLDANVAVVVADERTSSDVCGEVWRTGGFGEEGASPELTACVLSTGAVGVFPGPKATCSGLGLAELPASYSEQMKGFAGLQAAIVAKLGEPPSGSSRGGPECVPEDDARLIVKRELDIRGYSDWEVETAGAFTEARPCADVSFDTGGKTVILVPGSR